MFNNFGAVTADILSKFAMGGYTPVDADFGGTAALQEALDDAVRGVVQALPALLRDNIQRPELMLCENRAAAGQTTATLKLSPAVAGKTHVWAGMPQSFVSRPILVTNPWQRGTMLVGVQTGGLYLPTPPGSTTELAEDQFTVTGQNIVLVSGLQRNSLVYATYEVDVENAAFAMPSLADLAVHGAASMLGSKLYPQASAEWAYVSRLSSAWAEGLAGLASGEWVPAELRVIQWWKAPEPDGAEGRVSTVRRYRA